jgi:hypothetical protein
VCVSCLQEDAKVLNWIKKFRKGTKASVCAAAIGISKRTFYRWEAADVKAPPKLGAPTLLSPEIEEELALMLIRCADAVVGFSKPAFRRWMRESLDIVTKGRSTFVASEGWMDDFLTRHPVLKNRIAAKVLPERVDGWTEDIAARFFGQVRAVALQFTPDCVANMDEAGLEFEEASKMVSPLYPLRFSLCA